MKRALIVTRLSKVTDVTTSPERQLQQCRDLIAQRGYLEVGVAEDLDVSGAVDPFDRRRPQLSDWLNNRAPEFDVVVVYRVDRLSRSVRYLQKLVAWAEDHGKIVVSATEPHFDMEMPFSAVIIALLGTVAQMELEAISDRNRSTAAFNIKAGRYRGGTPPWGYRVTDKHLEVDPEQRGYILEAAQRVLSGEPLGRIAEDWNSRGILTVRDRFAVSQGRKPKGLRWSKTVLEGQLTSRTLLGHSVHKGSTVLSEDGSPLQVAEPILDRATLDQVAHELASRKTRKDPTKRTDSLLLRVIQCDCGQPAYKLKGAVRRGVGDDTPCRRGVGDGPALSHPSRYRCSTQVHGKKWCGNGSVVQSDADQVVETLVLGMLGESERLTRQWDPGSDHSVELSDAEDELRDLTSIIGTGPYRAGTAARDQLDQRILLLSDRIDQLRQLAVKPSGWTWKGTGQLFSEWWAAASVIDRNVWLRSMGVTLTFTKPGRNVPPEWHLDLGDLTTLTEQLDPRGPVARWQSVLTEMSEAGVPGITLDPRTAP
ncbi:recombinase family protein [Tsukamurella paurometabola]|uniref:Recombinase family protein n=1 Tax=Tsukamurella paurometabola TaxID=2061 RepID=A0ABS5NI91_TSUPA|nr:recombinase family protein [Tsukamurella paurometabola]MBS4103963.1 recombinase family protein [Tsukamurella paurometabola]